MKKERFILKNTFSRQFRLQTSTLSFVLFLACMMLTTKLSSQPKDPLFYLIESNLGLLSDRTTCSYQDHIGYIWIGTEMGLSRYTGTGAPRSGAFTNYVANPKDSTALSNDYITALYEDPLRNFWVGTKSGLCLYDFEYDRFHQIEGKHPALSNEPVQALVFHDGQ
ncbi:MAG: two-component regulator propeller domain-containing protein, partial [Bacteroidota bacterium]